MVSFFYIFEGVLEVKLPAIWTDAKAEVGRVREEKREERRSEKRKSQKKEDAGARKGRKVAKHGVSPMICGSGGSKSRLAKAAGAEPSGQMRDEKLHAIVAQSTFASEKAKTPHVRSAFGSCDVEKVQAVVARSTFPSQNVQSRHTILRPLLEVEMLKSARRCGAKPFRSQHVQNTLRSEHSWKLRCSKSVRRCGAKHISKSKCTKHHMSAPLLDVEALFCVAAQGALHRAKSEKNVTHEEG